MKDNVRKLEPHQLPIRFDEIKYMCQRYPYLVLKNKNGFTVMIRSKVIMNTSVFINTDLTTTWVDVIGVTWFDYFLIRIRLRHADQL
jgi:hypothetical protein